MTTKHDYMAVLSGLKTVTEHVNGETNITTAGLSVVWLETHMGAIVNALKVAQAVMQRPSFEAAIAGAKERKDKSKRGVFVETELQAMQFIAIRDKMLEGVE